MAAAITVVGSGVGAVRNVKASSDSMWLPPARGAAGRVGMVANAAARHNVPQASIPSQIAGNVVHGGHRELHRQGTGTEREVRSAAAAAG